MITKPCVSGQAPAHPKGSGPEHGPVAPKPLAGLSLVSGATGLSNSNQKCDQHQN